MASFTILLVDWMASLSRHVQRNSLSHYYNYYCYHYYFANASTATFYSHTTASPSTEWSRIRSSPNFQYGTGGLHRVCHCVCVATLTKVRCWHVPHICGGFLYIDLVQCRLRFNIGQLERRSLKQGGRIVESKTINLFVTEDNCQSFSSILTQTQLYEKWRGEWQWQQKAILMRAHNH